jgi:hypothetical protein
VVGLDIAFSIIITIIASIGIIKVFASVAFSITVVSGYYCMNRIEVGSMIHSLVLSSIAEAS